MSSSDSMACCMKSSEQERIPMTEQLFSCKGATVVAIEADGIAATGVSVNLPGTEICIHQVRCALGLILCGAFSTDFADGKDVPMALFTMPLITDMLERTPKHLNPAALALGATPEMTGAQLMKLFS